MKHIVKVKNLTAKIYKALDKIEEILSKTQSEVDSYNVQKFVPVTVKKVDIIKPKRKYNKKKSK